MNRAETLALFAQGKDAWNAWANDMLAKRKALEAAGEWKFDALDDPETDAAKAWAETAAVEFSTRAEPHTFAGAADFRGWVFPWSAGFGSATFEGYAGFSSAKFEGDAGFSSATFKGTAGFDGAKFEGDAGFDGAKFEGDAGFGQATYDGFASYENATFIGNASFAAIRSERAFSLAGADFHRVPDFIQAHFSEAPRLDNSHFRPGFVEPGSFWGPLKSRVKRLFGGDPDVPARWRALKRLAIQGHDHEREQAFFPMEIRSARFLTDWPLPLQPYVNRRRIEKFRKWLAIDPKKRLSAWLWKKPFAFLATSVPIVFWRGAAWLGFFRFWFGIVYQILSNFGRSVLRPALFFLALAAVSAVLYLQESDGSNGAAPKPFADLARAVVTSPVTSAAGLSAAHPCFSGDGQSLGGLSPLEAARTDKISEALHLAFANGSIVGSLGTSESARRTYGCLYGFVRDPGGASHLVVPPGVTLWATLQKTLSVILIFLFGLALRNMLKVR